MIKQNVGPCYTPYSVNTLNNLIEYDYQEYKYGRFFTEPRDMSTWLFTNIETAECPYTECKMWLKDCETPLTPWNKYIWFPEERTSAPWQYKSTTWE